MKSTSVWKGQYKSVVDNGKGHSVTVDLPANYGGTNEGPTSFELCLMSLSGCISTIFAMMAEKMRLTFESLDVTIEAEKPKDAPTFTEVYIMVNIKTTENHDKIEKCLEQTVKTCPVGVLFRQAGIKMERELNFL